MIRLAAVFFVIVAVSTAVPTLELLQATKWVTFKTTHNKQYRSLEHEVSRLLIFNRNLNEIDEHNKLYEAGLSTYKLGVTPFTDLTKEEFLSHINKYNISTVSRLRSQVYEAPADGELPTSIDWRDKGAVTAIKDQGACNACWSFSTTGALEAQYFLKTGTLVSLSDQSLIDCTGSYGNEGCLGGMMDYAFEYVRDHGIQSEADYPYVAEQQSCKATADNVVTSIANFTDIYTETDLISAVANVGPISIGFDATANLQNYISGVFTDTACTRFKLNHAALLVGYTDEYYIVKNSWGAKWGEDGYFKVSRTVSNPCGIASLPSYPTI